MSTWPKTFETDKQLQIAMPMGGIGAGCVCLNGYGGIQDFSIRNHPETSAVPDHWDRTDAAFALIHIKGGTTKLVEGPLPKELIYAQSTQGQGYRKGDYHGLPRFKQCVFKGQFPFGVVELADPAVPLNVSVEGWSPFIPLDDVNSGIPAAMLNYTFTNTSSDPVEFEFSYHLAHPARTDDDDRSTRNRAIPGGAYLYNSEDPASTKFGSAAVAVVGHDPKIKAAWFRGGWFDSVSALWREVSTGAFSTNDGVHCDAGLSGRNGGSVLVAATLAPGESVTIPVVLTWYFPNVPFSTFGGGLEKETRPWSPFYTTQWADAAEVAAYVTTHYDQLLARTRAFSHALYASTIPYEAMDAVASNLAILKSPTILRQANGRMWGWEGCFTDRGSCPGSCTHVWNYAQAICHLFPALERSLREEEYEYAMDDRGHINFRASVPSGPAPHEYHAASDGQLGGILKLHRDWQISGDLAWLSEMYPLAKRALDYGIATWDPDKLGALMEPHHNTYDIEFWGADGMCTSIYLGALCAIAQLAHALGLAEDAIRYEWLAAKSAAYMDAHLFNGEYYVQNVQWEGLRDASFATEMAGLRGKSQLSEMDSLLLAEGPKYQYGNGCISDGVIGAWMAEIYGVQTPLSQDNVRSHLRALYRHNFKRDLSEHACVQRPGYAIGDEAGLILCSWPGRDKPTLPFVYSDEVWTGIEYQVASHMISVGLVSEGLELVAAARSRYDGHTRNPYNEYECGSYYARAMASFAVLGSLSGFRYSAVSRTLWLSPKVDGPFTALFSAASGWGTVSVDGDKVKVNVVEGRLDVAEVVLKGVPVPLGPSS